MPRLTLPRPKDRKIASSFRGWILYDGDCHSCTALARRFEQTFRRRGFLSFPLQTEWVVRQFGFDPGAPRAEMHVLTNAGENIAGANAVIFLARQIWWTWPLVLVAQLPGVHSVLERGYRWVAVHRGCDHGCGLKERPLPSQRIEKTSVWRKLLLDVFPGGILLIALPISVLIYGKAAL